MSAPSTLHMEVCCERAGFSLALAAQLPGRGITVLFGPSGSGKTTLLRCVAGLEPGVQGRIGFGDQVWLDSAQRIHRPAHQRRVGYVFQEASLFTHLDVRRNLAYGLTRVRSPRAAQILDEAVSLLGIEHLLPRAVEGLSGGERQRVAIARALVTQPDVLLLDEPLAALDAARKREVLPWLERLRDELQIPMMYVTHSVEELTRLGDHLVVLHEGRVRASGPLAETFAALDAHALDGQEQGVLLDAKVIERATEWHLARVAFDGGELWVRDDGLTLGASVRTRVLARDVSLSTQMPAHTSIQNQVPVRIEALLPDAHPSQSLVRLRCGSGLLLARITQRSWHALELTVGQSVWAQVKSVAVVH